MSLRTPNYPTISLGLWLATSVREEHTHIGYLSEVIVFWQVWLEKQSAARVGMVETRRAIKHFLLKMAEEAHEFERSGRFTAIETNGFMRKIKYLQAKNHFVYGSTKFQAAFATAEDDFKSRGTSFTSDDGVELTNNVAAAQGEGALPERCSGGEDGPVPSMGHNLADGTGPSDPTVAV